METWLKILLISIAAIVLVAAICIVIFIILKKRHKATILEEFPQLILSLGGKENIYLTEPLNIKDLHNLISKVY